jgi:hypothetical protein
MSAGYVVAMPHEDEQEPDPSIVLPGPIDEEPSSTGLVADDEAAEVDTEEG